MRRKILMAFFGALAGLFIFASGAKAANIKIISPNGGESLIVGNSYDVKWSSSDLDSYDLVDIHMKSIDGSIDCFLDRTTVSIAKLNFILPLACRPDNGSSQIVYNIVPGQYKITIFTVYSSGINDISDAPFNILVATTSPSIAVLSPDGGEKLNIGSPYQIKWNMKNIEEVNIKLRKKKGFFGYIPIASNIKNVGSYSWVVPSNELISPADDYKIEITDAKNPDVVYDQSNDYFSITGISSPAQQRFLKIVSPNGGEIWEKGKTYTISWQSSGYTKVAVYVQCESYEANPIFNVLSGPDGGSYSYVVPENWADQKDQKFCKVKVGEPFSLTDLDYSDNSFSIMSVIQLTTPSTFQPLVASITQPQITSVSQLKSGDLVKTPSDSSVYIIKDGQKIKINSPKEFEEKGYKWDQIQTVQSDLLAQIAELKAQVRQLREDIAKAGALLKSMTGHDIYVIVDGKKEKIPDPETFNKRGYKWDQIQFVSPEELAGIPDYITQQTTAYSAGVAIGSLVKSSGSPTVYYITKSGAKKPILNPKVFNSYGGNKWEDIKTVSQDDINVHPMVNAIRFGNDPKVYFISNGQKQWVKTPEAFAKQGLKWDQIVSVNKTEFDEYKEGEEIK